MSAQLEEMLKRIETLAGGNRDTFDDHMTPALALALVSAVHDALAEKRSALAPGTGDMPERPSQSVCREAKVPHAYCSALTTQRYCEDVEYLLRASTAEVHRLRELISEADFEGGSLVYASDHKKIVERERASGREQGRKESAAAICAYCKYRPDTPPVERHGVWSHPEVAVRGDGSEFDCSPTCCTQAILALPEASK